VKDKLEAMRKETIVAYFTVLSRHSPGGTEENPVWMSSLRAEIRVPNVSVTKQEY